MLLTSEYLITDKDGILSEVAKEANNLYNAGLYQVRYQLIRNHKFVNYGWLDKCFKTKYRNNENMLYHKLGYVQSAQQTLKEVIKNRDLWLTNLKAFKKNPKLFNFHKPGMPKYLSKGKRHTFFVTNQDAKVKGGYLVIPRLNVKVKLADNLGKVKRVTFKPLPRKKFKMLVQYEVPDVKLKEDNGIYVGIDAGLDNAFTCVTNANEKPLIINGKGVKSVNQYYNKQRALLSKKHAQYHQCCKNIHTKQGAKTIYYESQKMLAISDWRNTKVKQFAHKATKCIIDYALNCGANTIIIGNNKGLKNGFNLGRRNNQNFLGIPHYAMVKMIEYKAQMVGIKVIKTNESYTSQTSFLDGEKPCPQNGNYHRKLKGLSPAKRRIKRGLFKTNQGILINADVNGALQIIRKVFPKFKLDNGTEGLVLNPVKYNVNF